MDQAMWALMNIIGPAILLIVLLWLVWRSWRRTRPNDIRHTEQATHDLYEEEETRRRERTDDL
ncbi:MAG TPA: hypothetical protein VNH53_02010 [Sphingomicrobium sp.]|jgi:ABC-type nickel/cobalt efflux system permease component RcnA|nr:hypothetical protein [Sphingomicrobium sp.]